MATFAPAPRGNVRALREIVAKCNGPEVLDDEFEATIAAALSQVSADVENAGTAPTFPSNAPR